MRAGWPRQALGNSGPGKGRRLGQPLQASPASPGFSNAFARGSPGTKGRSAGVRGGEREPYARVSCKWDARVTAPTTSPTPGDNTRHRGWVQVGDSRLGGAARLWSIRHAWRSSCPQMPWLSGRRGVFPVGRGKRAFLHLRGAAWRDLQGFLQQ